MLQFSFSQRRRGCRNKIALQYNYRELLFRNPVVASIYIRNETKFVQIVRLVSLVILIVLFLAAVGKFSLLIFYNCCLIESEDLKGKYYLANISYQMQLPTEHTFVYFCK